MFRVQGTPGSRASPRNRIAPRATPSIRFVADSGFDVEIKVQALMLTFLGIRGYGLRFGL